MFVIPWEWLGGGIPFTCLCRLEVEMFFTLVVLLIVVVNCGFASKQVIYLSVYLSVSVSSFAQTRAWKLLHNNKVDNQLKHNFNSDS